MKRIIIIVFIFILLFLTNHMHGSITQVENEVKDVLNKVSPSLVKVVCQYQKNYIATGIAVDKDYILTNIMVISNPCQQIYVVTAAGQKYPAEVVGKDSQSSLTVLRIDSKSLKPIQMADRYEVGDWIALVGAFYKEFPSIFQGILSSTSPDEMILNAPAVPGASGGAVVNKKGELIGVIRGTFGFVMSPDYTFKDHSGELLVKSPRLQNKDLCYALPINRVNQVYHELRQYGKVRRGWLGITIVSDGQQVRIGDVVKGSPAEKAGLKSGDIFLAIDGQPIGEPIEITRIVRVVKPDQKVKINIQRDRKEKVVDVVIGEFKDAEDIDWEQVKPMFTGSPVPLPGMENYVFNFSGSRTLGVELVELTPELAKEFRVKEGFGLMISRVYDGSAAQKAGLTVADILVEAGDLKTGQVNDIRAALAKVKDNESMPLKLYRKGQAQAMKVIPDKSNQDWNYFLDEFQDKVKKLNIKIDPKTTQKLRQILELKGDRLKVDGQTIQLDAIRKYQTQLEAMKREQERLKKEIQRLTEELEKK